MTGFLALFNSSLLFVVVLSTTPILLAGLGALFTQRADILNVAIEGMMLVGAFAAIAIGAQTQSVLLALAAAVASGLLMALIFAYVSLVLKADFIVAGIGINLLASGFTVFLLTQLYNNAGSYSPTHFPRLWQLQSPVLGAIPVLGPALNGQSVIVYAALLAVVVSHVVLYHTPLGVHIRATGESPEAVEAAGLSTLRIKFLTILISGFAAGLAGAQLSMATLDIFVKDMSNGRGFIGLAAMLFGGATPIGTLLGSLVFGFADALSDRLQLTHLPPQFVLMLPYVVTVLALTFAQIGRLRRHRRAAIARTALVDSTPALAGSGS